MSSPTQPRAPRSATKRAAAPAQPKAPVRIVVGVDGYPEGRDAAALGAAIAGVTGTDLMLVAVHSNPMIPMPSEMGWKGLRKQADGTLRHVRDSLAPGARIVTETDLSIPRALHRVVREHHCDLLVVGSSRDAVDGRVRIGKRTRQLLCHVECALAIAPRGTHKQPHIRLRRIGVGYDGGPESESALALASSLAAAAGAELHVRGVVDDRIPVLMRSALDGLVDTEWTNVIREEEQRLNDQCLAATKAADAQVRIEVLRGRPADALLALSCEVDLLVIGSRRWGTPARVLLGSTGEALLHDAACPVLAVPRPANGLEMPGAGG
jgi:nucleotide-binding universal stress UspA family protein